MTYAILLMFSYFLGSIPFGVIVGKMMRGVDIREFGSGNIGATNVYRTLGPGPGIVVFASDVLKGLIPVLIAKQIVPGVEWFIVLTGMMAILGHTLSPFLKFRGGRGAATSLGVAVALVPLIAAIVFVAWVLIIAVTRYVSLASMLAAASAPVLMWVVRSPMEYRIFGVFVAAYVIVKHRDNIVRLVQGKENKFGKRVSPDRNKTEG